MTRCGALTGLLLTGMTLTACTSMGDADGPPRGGSTSIPDLPGDAIPRQEPKSRYGNGPIYEVFGKTYRVMDSSDGYRERGVASWYGKKFHGRLTSNRETYDMYAMTAAHKSLPLPTYVKVRNLRNDKSVIVRVNDRGPFVHNRIIDLSYAAALKLDMVNDGTSLVEVTVVGYDDSTQDQPVRVVTPAPAPLSHTPVAPAEATPAPSVAAPAAEPQPGEHTVYVQVGAFGSEENARRRLALLQSSGIGNSMLHEDEAEGGTIYRVRIGPVREVLQFDLLVEELENIGIFDPYLVTD